MCVTAPFRAGALEKALDMYVVFCQKASSQLLSEALLPSFKMLVEKCVSHNKASVKQKAYDVTFACLDTAENFGEVCEFLAEMLGNKKVPKVRVARFTGPGPNSGYERREHANR